MRCELDLYCDLLDFNAADHSGCPAVKKIVMMQYSFKLAMHSTINKVNQAQVEWVHFEDSVFSA